MKKRIFNVMWVAVVSVLSQGCTSSSNSGGSTHSITLTANFLNGATLASTSSLEKQDRAQTPSVHAQSLSSGTWYLAPNQMTLTAIGACLIPSGSTSCTISDFTDTCTVVYSQSNPSLTSLAKCGFTATAGTYIGLTLEWSSTYSIMISDTTNNIYTVSGTTTLSTTGPGVAISIQDTNANGQSTTQSTTWFTSKRTISSTSVPTISVLFDPTHWLDSSFDGTSFTAAAKMGGNPPVYAVLGSVGKALLYNNGAAVNTASGASGTGAGNVLEGTGNNVTSLYELKAFFDSNSSPVSIAGALCSGTNLFVAWPASPPTGCASQSGGCFGQGGYLGLDTTNNLLSWAYPSGTTWSYSSYSTLAELPYGPTAPTVGDSYTLSYVCNPTGSITPTGGASTYTTAPAVPASSLSNFGTVNTQSLILVAD